MLERFGKIVEDLADAYGVKNDPDIHHLVETLLRAIESKAKATGLPQRQSPRKKFIRIFFNRYIILTDMEYPTKLTGTECRMIDTLLKSLDDKQVDMEIFLNWFFDDFIPDNQKLSPPTVKLACSKHILARFFVTNREELEEVKKQNELQRHKVEILNLARAKYRETGDDNIRVALRDWNDGKISLEVLKNFVANARAPAAKISLMDRIKSSANKEIGEPSGPGIADKPNQ